MSEWLLCTAVEAVCFHSFSGWSDYALKCLPETLPVMTLQLEAEITLKSCDARVCLHLLLESKIKPFFQSEFSILLILVFVQECSKRANYGKFTLRDLLVVPMQRVLKYHLLLQVLYSVLVHPRL